MSEKARIYYLRPRKTFDEIFEEYGVMDRVNTEMMREWGNVVGEVWAHLVEEAEKLGRRLGVAEEKLTEFVEDVLKTSLFYLLAFEAIERMEVEEAEEK